MSISSDEVSNLPLDNIVQLGEKTPMRRDLARYDRLTGSFLFFSLVPIITQSMAILPLRVVRTVEQLRLGFVHGKAFLSILSDFVFRFRFRSDDIFPIGFRLFVHLRHWCKFFSDRSVALQMSAGDSATRWHRITSIVVHELDSRRERGSI